MDGNDYSIEFWVQTTATPPSGDQAYNGQALVFSDIPGGPDLDWSIGYVHTLHDIDFVNVVSFTTGEAPNPDAFIQSQTDISDGNWHHIVCVRTLGVDKRMYVDGKLESMGPTGSGTQAAYNYIGIGGITNGNYFNGCMQEVALYNYALTADQVAAHFLAGEGM
jgi:hypothetical protein